MTGFGTEDEHNLQRAVSPRAGEIEREQPQDPTPAEGPYYEESVDGEGHITPGKRRSSTDEKEIDDNGYFQGVTIDKGEDGDMEKGGENEKGKSAQMRRIQSTATEASVTTAAPSTAAIPKKKWYQKMNPLRWGKVPPVPKESGPSREYQAGFFSLLFFQWMAPLMTVGYRRPLERTDIWTVNPDRSADVLTTKLKTSFNKRVKRGDKHALVGALVETFFVEFWLGGILNLISSVLQVISPFTLRFLISFATDAYVANLEGTSPPSLRRGLGLAFGITIMQMVASLCVNHFIYRGFMVGGQSRGALIALIYEKSMVISGRAKAGNEDKPAEDEKEKKRAKKTKPGGPPGMALSDEPGWANGKIVNLMSVDTYRIDQAFGLFHMIWSAPVSCVVTLVLLLVNLTYSALAGFGLLVLGVPLLTRAIRSLFKRRKNINKVTDQRVSLTQEIIQAVRFVKYFGWESAFIERLDALRRSEIRSIQILLAIRNAINAVSLSLPVFASMLAFITYRLSHNDLTPASVFSSLALFNSLRLPLNMLPLVIGQVVDAMSSIKRVEEFLKAEEAEEDSKFDPDATYALELKDASFTWEKTENKKKAPGKGDSNTDSAPPKLDEKEMGDGGRPKSSSDGSTLIEENLPFHISGMNIAIGRNELVAVIGSVGSGKSSLLAAMAGDMRRTSGEVILGASRALCPQYAWIQNATVKDNILFGKEMDRQWYTEVIKACALQPDLDMLPNGDATEIGERGITISGGQKQRLNIARAIYFDADIVLMDDPLSAVDAHVGRHIFDNAIKGLLKDKARVLATHQLWVLNRCDRIVWMEDGKIQAVDTFDRLMAGHAGFRALMESTAVEEKREVEKQVNEDEAEEGDKKKKRKKNPGLMQAEERAVSSVGWDVWGKYIEASGSLMNAPVLLALLILSQGCNIATSLWLSYWTSNKFGYSDGTYIGVYAGLGAVQALLMFMFSVALSVLGTRASKKLLRLAVSRVLRAPMSFFDTTPLGRITNRFSRDVDVMDNTLTDAMRMYCFTLAMIISVFALIIAFFHYFAIALVPLFVIFMFASSYYRASAREVKRFESVLRSVVFAKFGEGLTGTACIRAYGLKDKFVQDLRNSIDDMNSAYYLTFSNQRWLSIRLDMVGNLLVFTTAILVVTSRFSVSPSIGGLVLSYILSIAQMIQFTVRQLAEVENGMNAVERLLHYGTQLEEEAPLHTIEVRPSWPEKGEIVFDNVEMRYRAGLPLVLKGLSMHVAGGERIGIVGRTGAGKSSIMSTLFRLVEISGGHITIDGVDISTMGLYDLRSRLAIIPQDPTLFKGTVRSNLDPFGEHSDMELWAALRQADLVQDDSPTNTSSGSSDSGIQETEAQGGVMVPATGTGEQQQLTQQGASKITLDSSVLEDGLNFSLGQRQLMALARALVRNSRIIVCDEATSSVDVETDDRIQATMAKAFKGRTLLVIAHRLRTILGYDRICVLDAGTIAELGSPEELYAMEGGIFRGMCERSGIGEREVRAAAMDGER